MAWIGLSGRGCMAWVPAGEVGVHHCYLNRPRLGSLGPVSRAPRHSAHYCAADTPECGADPPAAWWAHWRPIYTARPADRLFRLAIDSPAVCRSPSAAPSSVRSFRCLASPLSDS